MNGAVRVAALAALLLLASCGDAPTLVVPWDPATVEAQLPTVVAALNARDPQRALAELDDRATRGTLPEGGQHLRALALADLGRTQEALAAWDAELATHPGNGRGHALLAQLLLDAGRIDDARAQLALGMQYAGRDPIVALVAGRAALLADQDEEAARHFRDYLTTDPYSRQAAEAHHALAQIAARGGPAAAEQGRLHEETAQALTHLHDYLSSYQRRLIDDPKDAEAAYGVATAFLNLYVSMGRDPRLRDQAELALRHVLTLKLDDVRALYNLGFIRTEQRRWTEAREFFDQALAVDPDYAPARLNLALLLQRDGHAAEARAEFERVVATAPAKEDVARARLQLAQLFKAGTEPGDRERAIEQYRALLELYPDDELGVRPLLDKLLAAPATPDGTVPPDGTAPADDAAPPPAAPDAPPPAGDAPR